ncbi:hypothetical protein LOTGIDRAFT_157934 [Lottia gigantea]|uniref:Uncharacterized protein n=1 Tax=Lottia gigantea TaxID=225164 RepID=V4B2K5_LOTGI|nr:hypothetical protein LOTGIDRAFT_157934 [Lottia gigantea]ESP00652.1 hypothetical protein LOTGIDRAFT_157934 [Lottia gigantea]
MEENIFDIIRKNSVKKIKVALGTGLDVNQRNERKETPLLACVMHVKDVGCVTQLLNAGSDINDQNERGQTALIYASILNKLQMLSVLLKQNAVDVNKTDADGNTALMYACALGHAEVVSRLFQSHELGEHILDLDIKNNDRMTALDHATDRGHVNIIKLFANFKSEKRESPETNKDENWIEMKPMSDHSPTTVKCRQNSWDNMQKVIARVRKDSVVERPDLSLKMVRPLEPTITVTAPGEESHTVVSFDDETSPTIPQKRIPRSPISTKKDFNYAETDLEIEDFSLESLSDLIRTVRQCAQEIREIQEPLQNPILLTPPKSERKRKEKKKGKEGGNLRAKNTALRPDSIRLEIPETPRTRPMTLSDEENAVGDVDALSQTWPRQKDMSTERRMQRPDLLVKRASSMSPAKPRQKTNGDEKHLFSRMIEKFTHRKNQKLTSSAPGNIDQPSTSGTHDARITIPSIHQSISKTPIIRQDSKSSTNSGFENPGYTVEIIPPPEPPLERY